MRWGESFTNDRGKEAILYVTVHFEIKGIFLILKVRFDLLLKLLKLDVLNDESQISK
jgi:hypothetical protein